MAISIWPKGPASLINISSVLMSLAISRLVAEPLMVHLSDFRQDTNDTFSSHLSSPLQSSPASESPRWFNISPGTDYHGMRLVSRNKSKNNHKKETRVGGRTERKQKVNFWPEAYMSWGRGLNILSLLVYRIPPFVLVSLFLPGDNL